MRCCNDPRKKKKEKERLEESLKGKRKVKRSVEQRSMSDVNAARCFITVISFNKSSSREPRQFQGEIDF